MDILLKQFLFSYMKPFRNHLLFICDSAILVAVALALAQFSLRYGLPDAVGQGKLMPHLLLLYICTVIFQWVFHTYDSLWRYAESREYLALLGAAFFGFFVYEVISRLIIKSVISFILLTCIASLWIKITKLLCQTMMRLIKALPQSLG